MRRPALHCIAVLAILVLLSLPRQATAQSDIKPYILFVMDVSGSMDDPTGFGPPSCVGGADSRFDHAKCAISNFVNGYGDDMVMALSRFRLFSTDTACGNGCAINGIDCSPCNENNGNGCTALMSSADRLEVLVPIVDNNQSDLLEWVDFTCGTCTADQANQPELISTGWTPVGGSLRGAKRYFQGLDTPNIDPAVTGPYWSGPGDDPIRDDPTNNRFLPSGEQCRPYIVIQLTDGAETCEMFTGTEGAAADLLITDVDGTDYRIETKPIGFGISPGNNQIERIARAGGNPGDGVGGADEGYYAQNEAELSIAMAQIISEVLRFETCNDLDDDCDGSIDEDFALKGAACDDGLLGVCRGTGTFICTMDGSGLECFIDNPGQAATVETCNMLDDDCDGAVDEAPADCTGCTGVEICDNMDNDCDGAVDENVTRECGTDLGECTRGIETCTAGNWDNNCSGIGPEMEQCDGLDNNCDGTIDGFSEECGNPQIGICQPGNRTCTAGSWGMCIGEITPDPVEACDLLDNDCDGMTDEDTGGAACNSTCGMGTTQCINGVIECVGTGMPEPEICDGLDNDCDGPIDEGVPDNGPCDDGGTLCVEGTFICIGGSYQCIGGVPPEAEVCDCVDNDCDNTTDEGVNCPNGGSCIDCRCASPCQGGEFPCPLGQICNESNFCVQDLCFEVDCPPDMNGDLTQCVDGVCVPICDVVTCPGELVCRGSDGQCVPDNCTGFPDRCQEGELCVGGVCESDPCADVTCAGADEYCLDGDCITSCGSVECPEGQDCILGQCEEDLCNGQCNNNEVCDNGTCVADPCNGTNCPQGLACNPDNGQCQRDPCLGVECPGAGEVCDNGTCDVPPAPTDVDAGPEYDHVSAGGGGGCSASGESSGGAGMLAVMALLLLGMLVRRRRELGRTRPFLAVAAAGLSLVLATGCGQGSYPICVDNCGDGGDGDDGGGIDGGDGGVIYDASPYDACVPSGTEVCDGEDNDCDNSIDEGTLPGVGDTCSSNVGECVEGSNECIDGELVCGGGGVTPSAETCDGLDNDCDGTPDNGNPGGGEVCGNPQGECSTGITECTGGSVVCVGNVDPVPELCDGLDNDCDSMFDEGVPPGNACGVSDVGECSLGQENCIGGVMQCIGAVNPTIEQCDALDHDCDGDPTNGFNLDTDPQNCGACGNVCSDNFQVPDPRVARTRCNTMNCEIDTCETDYWDLDGVFDNGCEYGPCVFQGNAEVCNQIDDDCDGIADEAADLVVPDICDPDGACAVGGVLQPDCTVNGWVCDYANNRPDVQVDMNGDIIPETLCDDIDNDCDSRTDESHPGKGQPCDDGLDGICRGTGANECNVGDPSGPVVCNIDTPGQPVGTEICNNLDDDCDASTDEDSAMGQTQTWVDIGGGIEIFAYEASRPDADSGSSGAVDAVACSRPGVRPWANITYPDAVVACASLGARLCTESEWQQACEALPQTPASPPLQGPAPEGLVWVEAEDYDNTVAQGGHSWVFDNSVAGYSGTGAMLATPDNGTLRENTYLTQSPRLDFDIEFTQTGTHYLWIRGYAADSNDDSVHAGIDNTGPGTANRIARWLDSWGWVGFAQDGTPVTVDVPTVGVHTINIWMREDGFRVDKIVLTTDPDYSPIALGPDGNCDWSYATDCYTYQPGVCNGNEYDVDPMTPEIDDGLTTTGELAACYADWAAAGFVYDMSGNLREWTEARAPGINPMRGGTYTSPRNGLRCDFDFMVADDLFYFPNVGFRCCRGP